LKLVGAELARESGDWGGKRLFRWRSVVWFSTPFVIYALITNGLVDVDASELLDSTPVMVELVLISLLICVVFGLLLAYYFFTVKYLLANQWAPKWSTFQSLCERRFHLASGLPRSIVRGAALASIALGVCAILRYVAVRFRLAPWVPVLDLSSYQDSVFPSLVLVLTVTLRSLAVTLALSFSIVLLRKVVRHPALLVGCGALCWVLTCSYLFPWNPTSFLWFEWVVVFLFALVACFVFVYYDFFTLWFFFFSFYLAIDNYTMWRLFQNVSNFEYTIVFVLWGAIVALCVYSISSRRLSAAWRRLSLAFE
jgi:hypothetical protein